MGGTESSSLLNVIQDPNLLEKSDSKFTPQVLKKFGDYQVDIAELIRKLLEKKQEDTAEQIKFEHEQQLEEDENKKRAKKEEQLQKYYEDGKWDFDSLVDNHVLMEYIRNEKPNVWTEYNKYKQEQEVEKRRELDE